jgi:hypothetical protein
VLSLCIASACGSGAASTADTSGGVRRFRSSTYGYAIDHPIGWSTLHAGRELSGGEPPATGHDGTDILAARADRAVRAMTLPAVVIGAQRVAPETTLEEWTSTVIALVARMKGCPRPASDDRVQVGRDDGRLLAYPSCPSAPALHHLWAAFVHGGRGYHIVWFNTRGDVARDRARFEVMLASLSPAR